MHITLSEVTGHVVRGDWRGEGRGRGRGREGGKASVNFRTRNGRQMNVAVLAENSGFFSFRSQNDESQIPWQGQSLKKWESPKPLPYQFCRGICISYDPLIFCGMSTKKCSEVSAIARHFNDHLLSSFRIVSRGNRSIIYSTDIEARPLADSPDDSVPNGYVLRVSPKTSNVSATIEPLLPPGRIPTTLAQISLPLCGNETSSIQYNCTIFPGRRATTTSAIEIKPKLSSSSSLNWPCSVSGESRWRRKNPLARYDPERLFGSCTEVDGIVREINHLREDCHSYWHHKINSGDDGKNRFSYYKFFLNGVENRTSSTSKLEETAINVVSEVLVKESVLSLLVRLQQSFGAITRPTSKVDTRGACLIFEHLCSLYATSATSEVDEAVNFIDERVSRWQSSHTSIQPENMDRVNLLRSFLSMHSSGDGKVIDVETFSKIVSTFQSSDCAVFLVDWLVMKTICDVSVVVAFRDGAEGTESAEAADIIKVDGKKYEYSMNILDTEIKTASSCLKNRKEREEKFWGQKW